MDVPFVSLKEQYESIKEEIDKAVMSVLESGYYCEGEPVAKFEKEFAYFCNKKHAVGVSNGTDALKLSLIAAGIKKGDEVITVPNTFIADSETISIAGGKIRFADIDKQTYNMDPERLKEAITEKTKAILPVHLYGQSADMGEIREIAEKHGIRVIEDCAQAVCAEYKGKKVPATDTGCFSFYPSKNMGAYGDGGAVVTDDDEIAEKVRMLKDHGRLSKYEHLSEGFNNRLDTLQAAVLRVKLKHIERWTSMRRKNAKLYNELLGGKVITPYEAEYARHVYHLYVIRCRQGDRDKLQQFLRENGILTLIHYPTPLNLQPAYKGLKLGNFPVTEQYSKEILSMPMFPELTEEQITYTAEKVKEFIGS
ncbi:DegT/DnrJ/EryC1/StrS family aminotransferase [Candidatus Woesearchaeota archaeon]|nr:DegT/DnrJ/EryC1/StrS family aminotransferase [Candidatus Woesearchaeota archaeon]